MTTFIEHLLNKDMQTKLIVRLLTGHYRLKKRMSSLGRTEKGEELARLRLECIRELYPDTASNSAKTLEGDKKAKLDP